MDKREIPAETRAYIAGFFDGEGCLVSSIDKGRGRLRISISQKNPEVIFWLRETLGYGNAFRYERKTKKFKGSAGYIHHYRIHSYSEMKEFLELIKPHVREKREQVELALELIRLTSRKHMSEDTRNIRNSLALKLQELKGRGK